ncbi:hypothetical protein F4778DRAFT_731923 [Xylariomycetidae sp. FL2044]|nr:hypothetical protein F4778DRAFT_731923 [Xylariomycetidae sp. FL2044]
MRSISGLFSIFPLLSLAKAGLIQPGGTVRQEYDYVIVGGGAAGLVVASRLSEDVGVNVLVIEAGILDDDDYRIMAPGSIGREWAADLDYGFNTLPQTFLNGATRGFPQGKAVGGGTLLNGLVWTRASAADFDSWAGSLGNEGWSWDDLEPYFLRSEDYNGTVTQFSSVEMDVAPVEADHSETGPVQVSYTPYFYQDQAESFQHGCAELGINIIGDGNTGSMTGAYVAPASMEDIRRSRSSARTAYWNPIADRTNLDLLIGTKATRILFDRSGEEPRATGVEFAVSAAGPVSTVTAAQEVIVAGGAVWSPTLLQVSGIGRRAALESIGVEVIVDLPGVGNNLQDHPMVSPVYDFTVPGLFTSNNLTGQEQQDALTEWEQFGTGPYSSPMISYLAYPTLASVAADYDDLIAGVRNGQVANELPAYYDDDQRRGYAAQVASTLDILDSNEVPVWEVMPTSYGELTISIMHSFSRGNVTAASASVFDAPLIDPRYCSNAFDCDLLLRGLRWNDRLVATEAMQPLLPVARDGFGPAVDDATLRQSLYGSLRTNFHPSGTAAMLARDHGGVVDNQLRVYGVQGLRVIDASIFPTIPGGHLQAVVYAVAERAADLIRGAQTGGDSGSGSGSGDGSGNNSPVGGGSNGGNAPGNTDTVVPGGSPNGNLSSTFPYPNQTSNSGHDSQGSSPSSSGNNNNSNDNGSGIDISLGGGGLLPNVSISIPTPVLNPERLPAVIHAAINAWLEGKGPRPNTFLDGLSIFPEGQDQQAQQQDGGKKLKCGLKKRRGNARRH